MDYDVYDVIKEYQVDGLTVVIGTTFCPEHPQHYFGGAPTHELDKIVEKIDQGEYQWFNLRVQVKKGALVLATEYLNANLYPKVSDVLEDGVAEELVDLALDAAHLQIAEVADFSANHDDSVEAQLIRIEAKLDMMLRQLETK